MIYIYIYVHVFYPLNFLPNIVPTYIGTPEELRSPSHDICFPSSSSVPHRYALKKERCIILCRYRILYYIILPTQPRGKKFDNATTDRINRSRTSAAESEI